MNRRLLGCGMVIFSVGLGLLIMNGFNRLAILLGTNVPNMNFDLTEFFTFIHIFLMCLGSCFIALAFPKKF